MTGKQLFDKYQKEGGQYAQTLTTAAMILPDPQELYDVLETAEKEGKKIVLVELPDGILGEPTEIELV